MRLYSNQFIRWQSFDGGRLSTVIDNSLYALDLEKEADMLEEFQSHVTSMLYDSGFKNMKKVENITFKFEPEGEIIKLKQVVMNKFGCPDVTFAEDISLTKSKFLSLVNNDEFKRVTTLFYVGSLPEMHADVVAREPLPWLEFLLKYTYPSLQVYYAEDADILNDMTLGSCFADSVLSGDAAIEDFISESLKDLLSTPDAFLEEFAKNLCKKPEELDEEKKTLKERIVQGASGAYEKEKATITKGNPYFETVFETIERDLGYTSSADEQRDVMYEKVINPLGYCGWIALMMKALECVGKGLPIDEFKEAMVEAALDAMDDVAFQKMLIGLPPDVQAKLAGDMADELTGLPAPWDTQAYQIGNYPGAAFTNEMLYTDEQKMENDEFAAASKTTDDAFDEVERISQQSYDVALLKNPYLENPSKELDQAAFDVYQNSGLDTVGAFTAAMADLAKVNNELFPGTAINPPDTSGGILGIGYDGEDFSFGEQSKGSGGTYATALGNIQKDVFDAYKNQALKSIGVDTLLDEMGKLPGAPIIAGFLTSLPCKPTPPWAFDPRLDSFMNTIEFDFCQIPNGATPDITAPELSTVMIGWSNIWRAFTAAVEEAIKSLLVQLAMQAIKSLLNWVLNLACDSLALLGASLGDLLTGSDNLKDLLAAGLCPDEDPETVNDALLDLFDTLGGLDGLFYR